MAIGQRYALEALTRYNYFPNQRKLEGELPPIFSSKRFTPEVADSIAGLNIENRKHTKGYDLVSYSLTRFNNIPRQLGICHPKPYSKLISQMKGYWDELACFIESETSFVRPREHQDGRLLIMNYGDEAQEKSQNITDGFAKRFIVNADIASCFHSIYSHSICWAVLGTFEGKSTHKRHWTVKLDKGIASLKRDETAGIPIGPGVSNIVVEIILGAIDKRLISKGYKFTRYIDDYKCFCTTEEEAQTFIRHLQQELSEYRLTLNLSKTKVIPLPLPVDDDWINRLKINSPLYSGLRRESFELHEHQAINYLDYAVGLNKSTPDGSVLKFALRNIMNHLSWEATRSVISYTFNLAWHYPAITPLLSDLFEKHDIQAGDYEQQLNELVIENCKNRRSDGIAWSLYLLHKHKLNVSNKAFGSALSSKDCISMCMLLKFGDHGGSIADFANKLVCEDDYSRDRFWLLLYQTYLTGGLLNEFHETKLFSKLKEHDVDFMPQEDINTYAEKYSDMRNENGGFLTFAPEDKKNAFLEMTYKDWLNKEKTARP